MRMSKKSKSEIPALHTRVRDRAVGPRMSGSLVAPLTRPQSLRVE